ncbi:MAG: tRNA preQ1(34) S-adenosylmethionine ribosyltransferase-isomerase QueA [Synergistaceae bacterium]|nr:tRNA preQ1(34) S-adenosylmethionine ribosyltransferase-isomerase QueA [Synergistaceae bacterium]
MTCDSERPGIYDLDAYDYYLPESLIAQTPAVPRDAARLLVWRVFGEFCEFSEFGEHKVRHRVFGDIVDYLRPGDLLVLNDTKVLPARLHGVRADSGNGGKAEILLLNPIPGEPGDFGKWRALVKPGRRLGIGSGVEVGGRVLRIVGEEDDGVRVVQVGTDREDVLSFLDENGVMPLPPYIKNINMGNARRDYQTVFARRDGSAAAPTAGLHFTEELLRRVEERGIEIARVTLHVGLDTFRPVKSSDIRQHRIHSEYCEIPDAAAAAVRACRARQGRVVAVGTTVVRTLESMAVSDGSVKPGFMDTELFIYPGFSFKATDALITNFHLPGSSLLMLVSAFVNHLEGGRREEAALNSLMEIYSLAVSEGYRFFSFGDAMLIEK